MTKRYSYEQDFMHSTNLPACASHLNEKTSKSDPFLRNILLRFYKTNLEKQKIRTIYGTKLKSLNHTKLIELSAKHKDHQVIPKSPVLKIMII
jgi:hypothetical protein